MKEADLVQKGRGDVVPRAAGPRNNLGKRKSAGWCKEVPGQRNGRAPVQEMLRARLPKAAQGAAPNGLTPQGAGSAATCIATSTVNGAVSALRRAKGSASGKQPPRPRRAHAEPGR